MTMNKTPMTLATVSLLAITACVPASENPNSNTQNGAMIGAATGLLIGVVAGDDAEERRRGAAIGAILGAGGGALIGQRLDQQEAELRASMGNNVSIVNTGNELIVTLPQDILFATDSATLRTDLQADLRALATNLQSYPNTTVNVIGHTDNVGDSSYNQGLSTRRAQSVASVLINSGVPSGRITAFGRGEDQPVASNANASGRQQNRRVQIVITPV